eukprot:223804_1
MAEKKAANAPIANDGNKSYGDPSYDATDSVRKTSLNGHKKSSMSTPLTRRKTTAGRTSMGQIITLNLDNKIERLSRWMIVYFIFAVANLSSNAIINETSSNSPADNRRPYQLWVASDVLLVVGIIVAWFSLHHVHDIGLVVYENYFKYIAAGLFFVSAILCCAAVGEQNKYNVCVADNIANDEQTYCESLTFALYWMSTIFLMFIGIDVLDVEKISFLFNERKVRIIVYGLNIFFMYIIIASDVDYYHRNANYGDALNRAFNVTESGLFVVGLMCFVLAFLIILSIFCSMALIDGQMFRKVAGIILLIGAGFTLFGLQVLVLFRALSYGMILSLVVVVMIVYDLQLL